MPRYYYPAPVQRYYDEPSAVNGDITPEALRAEVASNGVVTPKELGILLRTNNFNQDELRLLMQDADDNGRLDNQQILNRIFRREVRMEDERGRDASAAAAEMVRDYAGRGR